jgi:hypothetical protein
MRKKELILVNVAIGVLMASFGFIVFKLSINQNPFQTASTQTTVEDNEVTQNCSDNASLQIKDPEEVHLSKLTDYQEICGSFVTDTLMLFTGFSENHATAETNASRMADKLKKFHNSGVKPLVIVEPYISDSAMSYTAYLAGKYDDSMDHYFKILKESGVTGEIMGTWVPFPESNTPSWNNKGTEPKQFALSVNKYLSKLKEYFPKAHGSILLNATTYEPDDLGWENGDYINLNQYVDAIDKDLVDSFGIQGFPWMSNAQQRKRTIFKADEFLQPDFAIGAAQILRTRDIWVNTGTFASKYTDDTSKIVHLSLNERKALLNDILKVASNIREYQENEYRVSINLFSEDKSGLNEATDWSYFQDVESQAVLKEFLAKAHELEIPVSLFDKSR